MTDILDELYEEFALAVSVLTDELRVADSYFMIHDGLDEDLADGIAATASVQLGDPVYRMSGSYYRFKTPIVDENGRYNRDLLDRGNMEEYSLGDGAFLYYVNQPTVVACPTDLPNVWYFYIER